MDSALGSALFGETGRPFRRWPVTEEGGLPESEPGDLSPTHFQLWSLSSFTSVKVWARSCCPGPPSTMPSGRGGLHPLKPCARRNFPSPHLHIVRHLAPARILPFPWKPFTPWLSLVCPAHTRLLSKHVWLLSACCFLRLSVLSHPVLPCWRHSCAGVPAWVFPAEGYKQLYTLGKKTVSSYVLILLEFP